MKRLISYLLVFVFWLIVTTALAQVKVTQFNAGWNSANEVPWVMDLEDCNTYAYVDIAQDAEAQTKYKRSSKSNVKGTSSGGSLKTWVKQDWRQVGNPSKKCGEK